MKNCSLDFSDVLQNINYLHLYSKVSKKKNQKGLSASINYTLKSKQLIGSLL